MSLLLGLGLPLSLAILLGYYYRNPIRRRYYQLRFPYRALKKHTKKSVSSFTTYFERCVESMRRKFQRRLLSADVRLFDGKISAKEAFKWDLPRMLEFLGAAASNPGHFGVHSQHHSVLKAAVRILEGIRDDELAEGTSLGEDRRVGEEEGSQKRKNHIFTRDKVFIDVKPFKWEGIDLPCYSRYDSLVLVLSILGRAPRGATRRNHHLALLVLCAKFLILVAGDNPKGDAPNLVGITFVDEDGGDLCTQLADDLEDTHQLNVLLGATIPRHDPLKAEIRRLRYDFLEKQGKFYLPGEDGRWRFDGEYAKWTCGHCAETYALVLLKRNTTLSRNTVGGLAIKINSVLAMEDIDDVRLENLVDPCEACREGLRQCEIDWEDRFRKNAV